MSHLQNIHLRHVVFQPRITIPMPALQEPYALVEGLMRPNLPFHTLIFARLDRYTMAN